ncbi:hypothetical protein MBOT_06120 [Mycobacterium botniense]|uniref:Uncharacterized protein n=1 Tax=Mycobacterium botniense TaxID=84962 RepID=A0A7I9XV31_9MYCO|nr:hypothetical protein MBOT_06120 [Mycobacterium botniense]
MPSQQYRKGFVNEGGVGASRPHVPRTAEEFSVHSRAQPYAIHAIDGGPATRGDPLIRRKLCWLQRRSDPLDADPEAAEMFDL